MKRELSSEFSISFLCTYFHVSKSGYYAYQGRGLSKRDEKNQKILKEIKVIYKDSKKRYGSPRVTRALNKKGIECSRSKVERIMRVAGLKGLQAKSFKPNTTILLIRKEYLIGYMIMMKLSHKNQTKCGCLTSLISQQKRVLCIYL